MVVTHVLLSLDWLNNKNSYKNSLKMVIVFSLWGFCMYLHVNDELMLDVVVNLEGIGLSRSQHLSYALLFSLVLFLHLSMPFILSS